MSEHHHTTAIEGLWSQIKYDLTSRTQEMKENDNCYSSENEEVALTFDYEQGLKDEETSEHFSADAYDQGAIGNAIYRAIRLYAHAHHECVSDKIIKNLAGVIENYTI